MTLSPGDVPHPIALQLYLGKNNLPVLNTIGNSEILSHKKLGLFCSVRCPGSIIIQTYDFFDKFHSSEYAVIGGFHSPMEQECLHILLRNGQYVIYCPARGIEKMRVPGEFKKPLEGNRLLIISPFTIKERRATVETTSYRNLIAAALADTILISYAHPGGKTEELCRKVIEWDKPVFTFDNKENKNMLLLGAKTVTDQGFCN